MISTIVIMTIIAIAMFVFVAMNALILTMYERKFLGWMQSRMGPMEVGPWGSLQAFADMFKILAKGDVIPKSADKFMFAYAPLLSFCPAFIVFVFLYFGKVFNLSLIASNTNIGVLMVTAVMAISMIGIIVGGWASGNKFSLLGAVRSAAQQISYEIPKMMTLLCIVMMVGSMNLATIAESQKVWFILPQIVGFVIYVIACMAEVFRIPFDLAEGESELVAGFNVEYSGIRFVFFFFAEYTYLFVTGVLVTSLFLGGGQGPQILGGFSSLFWVFIKSGLIVTTILWISRSLPRVRPDQLMNLAWKGLIPVSILNFIYTAFLVIHPTWINFFVKKIL